MAGAFNKETLDLLNIETHNPNITRVLVIIKQLTDEITKLQTENTKAKIEIVQYKGLLPKSKGKNNQVNLTEIIDEHARQTAIATEQNSKMQAKCDELTAKLEAANQENQTLKKEIKVLRGLITMNYNEKLGTVKELLAPDMKPEVVPIVNPLQNELDRVKEENYQQNLQIKALQGEIKRLEEQFEAKKPLEQKIQELEKQVQELSYCLTEEDYKLNESKRGVVNAIKRKEETEKDLAQVLQTLKKERAFVLKEMDKQQVHIEMLRETIKQAQDEEKRLKEDKDALDARTIDLEKETAQLQADIQSSTEDNDLFQGALATIAAALKNVKQQRHGLVRKAKHLRENAKQAATAVNTLIAEGRETQQENADLQLYLYYNGNNYKALRAAYEALWSDYQKLKIALDVMNVQVYDLVPLTGAPNPNDPLPMGSNLKALIPPQSPFAAVGYNNNVNAANSQQTTPPPNFPRCHKPLITIKSP